MPKALGSMEESEIMRAYTLPKNLPRFRHHNHPTYSQISRITISLKIRKMTQSIRSTAAHKSLTETIAAGSGDSGPVRNAGFERNELWRHRQQLRLAKCGQEGRARKVGQV